MHPPYAQWRTPLRAKPDRSRNGKGARNGLARNAYAAAFIADRRIIFRLLKAKMLVAGKRSAEATVVMG